MDLPPVLACFAVASLSIAVWGHLPASLVGRASSRRICLGVVMGLSAVASMTVPLYMQDKVIMDLRGPLLGAAAFAGGPVSGAIAAAIALAYRIYLSGPAVWPGCIGIVIAALVGVLGHKIAAGRPATIAGLTCIAAAVAACIPLGLLLLPFSLSPSSAQTIVSLTLLSFGSTWLFVLCLQRDEQHRRLIAQDATYRTIFEALPDSLCAKDRDSRFIVANPATARLMGVASSAQLIGKTDADFYPAEMARMFREEELSALAGNAMRPLDQEVQFLDGTRCWLTSMKTPIRDQRGQIIGLVTHNREVTDRKKLEAELHRAQGYLQEAMSSMADGLVLYDLNGTIRFSNKRYREMFPLTADLRVVGGRFADIVRASVTRGEQRPPADIEAYVAERLRTFREPADRLLELNDGRTIESRSRPLEGSDTLVVLTDITSRCQLERELRRQAQQDPLTSLANRSAFETALAAAHRDACSSHAAFAVMMLDLDRFKPVNDTHGHSVGDRLLREIADRLRSAALPGTTVARLGGDEFALLIVAEDIETATVSLANRIVKSLKRPFQCDDLRLVPSGSLGIAYFPRHGDEPLGLMRVADKALYAAKTRGGGAWCIAPPATDTSRAGEAVKTASPSAA